MSEPHDNVLRALIYSTIDGQTGWHLHDVVDRGETYEVVLVWGTKEGREGIVPLRRLRGPKHLFEVVTDPSMPYELKCKGSVDFDALVFTDRVVPDADDLWKQISDTSIPPPDFDERNPAD